MAASTQNLAFGVAAVPVSRCVDVTLPWLDKVTQATKPARLPTVLTSRETRELLAKLPHDRSGLIVRLPHGTGMRLTEGLQVRVKDLDITRRELLVRHGKGGKERVTVLPESLVEPLHRHLVSRRALFDRDHAQRPADRAQ